MQVTAWTFFLVGLGHSVAITRMIYNSFKAKRLTFHSHASTTNVAQQAAASKTRICCLSCVLSVITTAWAKLFGRTGFFGVGGPYFEVLFTFREALEIIMQTYQAYYLSWSVPRAWINQLAVASIVLNCVASPIVHWHFKHNEAKRRLVNLLHDAMLDFCCSVVIPVSIVLPYALAFDTKKQGFAFELVMDDVWYVDAISEGRQVLVISFLDYVSTLFPQFGFLSCLLTIKNIVRRRKRSLQPTSDAEPVSPPSESTLKVSLPWRSMLRSTNLDGAKVSSLATEPSRVHQRLRHVIRDPEYVRRWRRVFAHSRFLLWGLAVLGVHVDANAKSLQDVVGCPFHVNAWVSKGYPCSVMLLNCHKASIRGSTQEVATIIDGLERSSLQAVVISNCPALEIPPVLTEFPRLGGMELCNCSLIDWPVEVALTETTLPQFSYLIFALTNWTTFPQGLLHRELPKPFTHLAVAAINITELPEAIGDAWGGPGMDHHEL